MGREDEYVAPEYVPSNFRFAEPSKLSKVDARAWLKFWYDRQQDPKIKTVFKFKKIKGKSGDPVDIVKSSTDAGKKKVTKTGGRAAKRKRPAQTAESSEESSSEESSEEESSGDSSKGEGDNPADGNDESQDSDQEEEEEDEAEEEEEEVEVELRGPRELPFSAVRKQYGAGTSASTSQQRPKAPPASKGRHQPNTGPQYEPRETRGKKRGEAAQDKERPAKRRRKGAVAKKTGPPIGGSNDQPPVRRGRSGK